MGSTGRLEIPQPEVLIARAMAVARLEAAALGHGDGGLIGEGNSQPGVVGRSSQRRISLHLELEQRARPEQAIHLAHVALDHLVAGDVLEDDGRKGEVEDALANYRKILPVVLIDEGVGPVGQRCASLAYHLAADIDGMHLAEQSGKRARNPAGSASDLEHAHLSRLFSLAYVVPLYE